MKALRVLVVGAGLAVWATLRRKRAQREQHARVWSSATDPLLADDAS